MWPKLLAHVLVGAALGYAWHRISLPLTGGACPLVCSPWRAMLLGAVVGALWPMGPAPTAGGRPLDLSTLRAEEGAMSELTIPDGAPVHVNEKDFVTLVESSRLPILLDAYAEWCGPCKMLAPELEEVARTYRGRLIVAKLDVDQNMGLARQLGIRGVPALFLIDRQHLRDSWTGYAPADQIRQRIERFLPAAVGD